MTELQEEKRGLSVGFVVSFDDAFRGWHCKSCKGLVGTCVSLGICTGWVGALYPDGPRAKNLSFVTVL